MTPHVVRLRMLLSFAYYAKDSPDLFFKDMCLGEDPDLVLDSGAFSALTLGKTITLAAYANWLRTWSPHAQWYSNLDVIGDAEATYVNQQRMLDMGLRPVPTFHVNEPWSYLERYLDEGYTLIALGGMVPHSKRPNALLPWLVRCFKMAKGRAALHGFGVAGWRIVRPLPWYSTDSSGFTYVFRSRTVILFDEKTGKLTDVQRDDPREMWGAGRAQIIRRLGFDPNEFMGDFTKGSDYRHRLSQLTVASYLSAERWVHRIHGDVFIPGTTTDPGYKLYLVTSYPEYFRGGAEAVRAVRRFIARKGMEAA